MGFNNYHQIYLRKIVNVSVTEHDVYLSRMQRTTGNDVMCVQGA